MPDFRRKSNRLDRAQYVGRQWYFITVCAEGRRPVLAEGSVTDFLLRILSEKCAKHSFNVYAYCFMPDHVHLECVGMSPDSDLIALTRDWKGVTRRELRRQGVHHFWQKGFYDHILREGDDANRVAWYIFNNPVRKGLVADPRNWPYSGSWMFDWKKTSAPVKEWAPPWSYRRPDPATI
jgi:REP-associated tyrosine transposase